MGKLSWLDIHTLYNINFLTILYFNESKSSVNIIGNVHLSIICGRNPQMIEKKFIAVQYAEIKI